MRLIRWDEEVIEVLLSRRNLLALLAKVDAHPPRSAATLVFPGTDEEPTLVVRAESDRQHYGHRGYGPVPMHPATEAWIRAGDLGAVDGRGGAEA